MVVVEIARALVPNKSSSSFKNEETEQAKQAMLEFLMRTSQITHNWLIDFPIKLK